MTRINHIEPVFVEEIPRELAPGALYVSMIYATAVHLCCCGCGSEVVTSLHPTRWRISYDGVDLTLRPSVGNWSLSCRSHYLITNNKVQWTRTWSKEEIEAVRAYDQADIRRYFKPEAPSIAKPRGEAERPPVDAGSSLLARLRRRLWH
jgi:hypothetical protein